MKPHSTLKTMICNASSLVYFDPNIYTTIQMDASGKGLGVALFQHEKPIVYASKSFSDTEHVMHVLSVKC